MYTNNRIVIDLGILVRYESKNDCFKEASLAIRNQCTELEKLDNEKTKCKFYNAYTVYCRYCRYEI